MPSSNRSSRVLRQPRKAAASSFSHTYGTSTAHLVGSLDLGLVKTDAGSLPTFAISGAQYVILDLSVMGDRVARVAGAFPRWRLKRYRVRYTPIVGTSTAGQLVVGSVDDSAYLSVLTAPTYAQVVSMRGSSESSVYMKNSMQIAPKQELPWLYTTTSNSTAGLQRDGQAGLVYIAGVGLAASTTYGEAVLDYDITFGGMSPVETPSLRATVRENQLKESCTIGENNSDGFVKLDYFPHGKQEKCVSTAIGKAADPDGGSSNALLAVSAAELDLLRLRRQSRIAESPSVGRQNPVPTVARP